MNHGGNRPPVQYVPGCDGISYAKNGSADMTDNGQTVPVDHTHHVTIHGIYTCLQIDKPVRKCTQAARRPLDSDISHLKVATDS